MSSRKTSAKIGGITFNRVNIGRKRTVIFTVANPIAQPIQIERIIVEPLDPSIYLNANDSFRLDASFSSDSSRGNAPLSSPSSSNSSRDCPFYLSLLPKLPLALDPHHEVECHVVFQPQSSGFFAAVVEVICSYPQPKQKITLHGEGEEPIGPQQIFYNPSVSPRDIIGSPADSYSISKFNYQGIDEDADDLFGHFVSEVSVTSPLTSSIPISRVSRRVGNSYISDTNSHTSKDWSQGSSDRREKREDSSFFPQQLFDNSRYSPSQRNGDSKYDMSSGNGYSSGEGRNSGRKTHSSPLTSHNLSQLNKMNDEEEETNDEEDEVMEKMYQLLKQMRTRKKKKKSKIPSVRMNGEDDQAFSVSSISSLENDEEYGGPTQVDLDVSSIHNEEDEEVNELDRSEERLKQVETSLQLSPQSAKFYRELATPDSRKKNKENGNWKQFATNSDPSNGTYSPSLDKLGKLFAETGKHSPSAPTPLHRPTTPQLASLYRNDEDRIQPGSPYVSKKYSNGI